eukprot:g10997.t1
MSFAKSANTSYNTSAPQTNYTELNNGRQNNMSYGSGSQSNNSDGYEYLMEDLKANLKAFQENINNINRLSKKIGKREDSEQVRQNIQINITSAKDTVTTMSSQLKRLNDFNKNVTGSEKSTRRSRQRKLMRDFQALVKNYEVSSQKALKLDDSNPLRYRSSSGFGSRDKASFNGNIPGNGPIEWTGKETFDEGEQEHLLAHEQALNQEMINDRHNAM